MKQIRENLASLFRLSEQELDIFLSAFRKTVMKKNDVFIERGKVCNAIGLIEKGLTVCMYEKNGDEIIEEFAFENGFITNYYSFLTQTPSEKEIRCIEDVVVHVLSRECLADLAKEYPFIEKMERIMNEKLFLRTHDRVKSLLLDSASERYFQLVSERSDLTQRIPQYLIASYLNVKPETISRIRKKLSTEIY